MNERKRIVRDGEYPHKAQYIYLYVSGLIKPITIYNDYMQIKLLLKENIVFNKWMHFNEVLIYSNMKWEWAMTEAH